MSVHLQCPEAIVQQLCCTSFYLLDNLFCLGLVDSCTYMESAQDRDTLIEQSPKYSNRTFSARSALFSNKHDQNCSLSQIPSLMY